MIIGIDIGGTKCAVVAADDQGNMGRVIRFPTTNVHDTLAAIFAAVHELQPDGQLEAYNGDVYKHAWLFQGAQRLGRFDVAVPVWNFLKSCQYANGGFPHF